MYTIFINHIKRYFLMILSSQSFFLQEIFPDDINSLNLHYPHVHDKIREK